MRLFRFRRSPRRAWVVVLCVALLGLAAVGEAGSATSFSDGFESGDFSAWTGVQRGGDGSAAVQSAVVRSGSHAARLSATTAPGSFAVARATLAGGPHVDLTATGDFRVVAEGAARSNVPIFHLHDAGGTLLVALYRQNQDFDKVWVQHSGGYHATTARLPLDTWARFEVHVVAAGAGASTVEVRQGATLVYRTTTASLGTGGVARLQIGYEIAGQAFTLVADDISATAGTGGGMTTTSSSTTTTTTTTPPGGSLPFSDGFESGDFSAWTGVQRGGDGSAAVQSAVVRSGSHAARLSATTAPGSFAVARATLAGGPHVDLTATGDFRVVAEGAARSNVPIFHLHDAGGALLVALYRQNQDFDKVWVQHSGGYHATTARLPLDTWARFEVHVVAAGAGASTVEVRQGATLVYRTTTASLGTGGVARLQIGYEIAGQAFTLVADDISATSGTGGGTTTTSTSTTTTSTSTTTTSTTTTTTAPPAGSTPDKLLIADLRNRRLLITDMDGRLVWKYDNPTGRSDGSAGPLGVRWMPGNQILATFGTGEVGLIDVATKTWVWKTTGCNGDSFRSPYEAELLPDGNLAVAMRFNDGGRVDVYDRRTCQVVWRHLLSNVHAVTYRSAAQSYNSEYPTLLIGGWGATKEVAYAPSAGQTGQTVTWNVRTEYTHRVAVMDNDDVLTTEGYYIQRINRAGRQIWRQSTPTGQEDRGVAIIPRGGLVFTGAEADRIEFRTAETGALVRTWSRLSDGSSVDYPYGIQVVDYPG